MIGMNVLLIIIIPKGLFPLQDTGIMVGGVKGPQDVSYNAMIKSVRQLAGVVKEDQAVQNVVCFTGGQGTTNSGFIFVILKPLEQRKVSVFTVMNRLRPKLNRIPGASLFLAPAQDIRTGGRQSNATYQYTIQADNFDDLAKWGPKLLAGMKKLPGLLDVDTDQQNGGLDELLHYDRATAAQLGLTTQALDSNLYAAFGQSEVSVIYTQLNQYYVVLEVAPQYL